MASVALDALLLPLLVIVVGAGLLRAAAIWLRQPPVLGEILLGIVLGPSILGHVWPEARETLFGGDARLILETVGWLGLVIFMYVAGSETRWSSTEPLATSFVAAGGLVLPFVLGLAVALSRPDWFFPAGPTSAGAIVVAVIMAVSALPVLARLLEDVGLAREPLGAVVLGAGTIDDVAAWILLSLAIAPGSVGLTGHLGANIVLVALVLALAFLLDRTVVRWMKRQSGLTSPVHFVLLVAAILAAALLTHAAGLHAFLGPFAVGAIVSRHEPLRRYAHDRLQGITAVLLLPAFFVLAGADVDIALIAGPQAALALAACFVAASFGKTIGGYMGGRAAGMRAQAALAAGLLLNARGAVGLVVAKVGYDAGLLHAAGYALVVLVIILTTVLAPPTLSAYVGWLARAAKARGSGRSS